MKNICRFGLILAALLLVMPPASIHTQTSLTLPADIIYETRTTNPNASFLVRIDAKTQKLSYFYGDAKSTVHILGWSPKGNRIAVYVNSSKICVLTRVGQLVSCMEGKVDTADSGNGAGGDADWYTINWSDDESKLYYITTTNEGVEHLVEGAVDTGKTLRVLYDKPDMDPYSAMPSPNGRALILGNRGPAMQPNAINLIQFGVNNTSATAPMALDRTLVVPFNKPANQQGNNEPDHIRIFCPFSPKGKYFTAYDGAGGLQAEVIPYEFDVFDSSGYIAYQLRYEINPIMPTENCPAWTPDESALFFKVYIPSPDGSGKYRADIYKYTLSTSQITPYYHTPEGLFDSATPMLVSSDGNYLLYTDGYDLPMTVVVGPNNVLQRFPGPFNGYSRHPFWVPPLQP